MLSVREVIVVEGRHDKNAVRAAVDAVVVETSGFGVFSDAEKLALLKKLADARGLIVLTDSDGAGFLIRNHLKGKLNGKNVKHAYIPDMPGRERRKRVPSKEGKLGVEAMSRDVIVAALRRAGATFTDGDGPPAREGGAITKADLFEAGLTGRPGCGERRLDLLTALGLPERLSPNALLDVLNALYTKIEFLRFLSQYRDNGQTL
jgi:ribonuclease M5